MAGSKASVTVTGSSWSRGAVPAVAADVGLGVMASVRDEAAAWMVAAALVPAVETVRTENVVIWSSVRPVTVQERSVGPAEQPGPMSVVTT